MSSSNPAIPHSELVSSSSLFPDLMRISGGFGQISGAGIFMMRTVIAGTTAAVTLGLTGAFIGALFYGTAALPFLVTSCAGFCLGAVAFYKDAARRAEISLLRYPRLMLMHLDGGFPNHGFLTWKLEDIAISRFRNDWTLRSMLMASWLGAQPALQRLFEAEEQERIEGYAADRLEAITKMQIES